MRIITKTYRAGKLWRVLVRLDDGTEQWLMSSAWVERDRK